MSESLRRAALMFFLVLFTAAVTFVPTNGTELQAQTSNPDLRYWKVIGNSGTDPSINFLGTTDNQPLIVKVNGNRVFRLEPTIGTPNIIGGFSGNAVTSGRFGATIAGGGDSGEPNRVTGSFGTVAGGSGNTASFNATVGGGVGNSSGQSAFVGGGAFNNASGGTATVAGGFRNTASDVAATVGGGSNNIAGSFDATVAGGESNFASGNNATVGGGRENSAGNFATVGGGDGNIASGLSALVGGGVRNTANGLEATVGGGLKNTSSGVLAAVGGGRENAASGFATTVPGGLLNTAGGSYALAAGRRAKATHAGSFVWGDSTDADVTSTGANQFIARASGGTTFYSNSSLTAGVALPPGGGSWSSLSDAAVKDYVSPVDPQEILRGVASLPLSTWKYESQDPSIRHIGPMAQDFKQAFGVGEDERYITTVDADGVALAAIQALNEKIEALQGQLARNGGAQTEAPIPVVWQAAALLVLAFGIGLAGTRVREQAGGWWSTR